MPAPTAARLGGRRRLHHNRARLDYLSPGRPSTSRAPSATTGTAGVAALATQSDVDTGTVTNEIVTPETLAAWSSRPRRATGTLGDGAATSFTLTHNFNTKAVHVAVYRNSGNYDEVEVEVRRNNVNSVDVLFTSAPTTNQYAYVIAY
jgi:hypothetical protein